MRPVLEPIACVVLVLSSVLSFARPTSAQTRPRPVVEVAAGPYMFPDDGIVTEGFIGTSLRYYLSPRVSVGPEVVFITGRNHSHFIATGNLAFDFLRQTPGRNGVTPFVVVGGGLFQSRSDFLARGSYTYNEGAFTAGGGVRVYVGRVTTGVEARIGWEAHLRVNGFIGVGL